MSQINAVTVVGASLAGLYAAQALRDQGFAGAITIIGDEPHRPYDRPPLSKAFLAGTIDEAALSLEADDDLDARWLLGSPAVSLDAATREVLLADGTSVPGDAVVIATGARARQLPGTEDMAGVHVLRTLDDALALRGALVPGARLVVIGAGFIGGEVAATAKALGLEDITVVEAAAAPLAGPLGGEMGRVVSGLHEANGVTLRCGVGVNRLLGDDRVTGVELADGTVVPADVVVVGIGAVPNTEWLEGSGVELGNGVECDRQGRTSVAGVVAVGDCASWHDVRLGRPHRVEHWTGAMERPAIAVATLLGGDSDDRSVSVPYFWSDQYDARIQFAGHAAEADSVTIEAGSVDDGSLLAVYRRGEVPVGVLGLNQSREFGRWRRQLNAVVAV